MFRPGLCELVRKISVLRTVSQVSPLQRSWYGVTLHLVCGQGQVLPRDWQVWDSLALTPFSDEH